MTISLFFFSFQSHKNNQPKEMATYDHILPTEEDLTVPEVNLTSASLRAGAFHMGKYCENQNNVSISSIKAQLVYSLRNFLMILLGVYVVPPGTE